MKKKKRFSLLKVLITIICLIAIIFSAASNFLFINDKTPNIFGRYIYIVGEDNPLPKYIDTDSALLAKAADDSSISALDVQDIILCFPADNPDKLSLRYISFIFDDENGEKSYYTMDQYHEDTDPISKDKIAAVVSGYPSSTELGKAVNFAKTIPGYISLLGIPFLLLVIMLVSALASKSDEEDDFDEDFGFYEYEEEEKKPAQKNSDPLYDRAPDTAPKPELERKKMSIAENFKQKEVNPDSPYQKEKERTMQFKAQKPYQAPSSSAESTFAAKNPGNTSASATPTAENLREEMLRKESDTEKTGTFNIRKPAESTVSDNTGILSAAQVAELRGSAPSAKNEEVAVPAPKRESSPDISDIIGKSSSARSAKKPSDMSVDDLLKIIETEKNKL